MAKHKAPTQVTIRREEKSLLMTTVDRFWKPAAAIVLVLSALLLFNIWSDQQAQASVGTEWVALDQAIRKGDRDAISEIRAEVAGTKVEAWATLAEGQAALGAGEETQAQEAFTRLSQTSDPVLSKLSLPLGPEGEGVTIANHLFQAAAAQSAWNAENPLLTNTAPAAGMPQVTFETDQGEIEITLYMDHAPIHAKNILKLAAEGFFDNTLFHRVVRTPSMWIVQGGDPNTIEGEESTWGQGGPGYDQTPEKNGLVHGRGFISAAAPSAGARSNGSQFFFTLGPCHYLDDRHTVFGKITSGLDVVEAIGEAEIRPPAGGLRDIPVEPVKVLATRVDLGE